MKVLLAVIVITCAMACKQTTPKKVQPLVDNIVPVTNIDSITYQYLNLKSAFLMDSIPLINAASTALTALSDPNRMRFLTPSELMLAPMLAALHLVVSDIPTKQNLKDKRKLFAATIEPLKAILQKVNNHKLYIQHCPMATGITTDDNAYWLSTYNDNRIRNPFFPKTMLECGDVTDTLQVIVSQ